MPSRLAGASSLPTCASVGIIHASSREKKQRGEEAESHHPWPDSRNANSVSSPDELDPFVDSNEWGRTCPAVGPALSDRASSRVTTSSASADNNDAGSSNESSGYAPFAPRATVARTAEHSGGGGGHDGSGGGDSGGLAAAIGKLLVHEPGRCSSRVRGRNGKNAAEMTCASGGDSGSEDQGEDEENRKTDSFRPSRGPTKGDVGSPVPGSKQLEVEWGLDEAFSMAMAGLRGGDRATKISARRSVPTAAGRGEYMDRGRSEEYSVSRQRLRENNDGEREVPVNEGSTARKGGDECQRARGPPNDKQKHSASSQPLSRNRNRPNDDRDIADGAAGAKGGVAVAARSSEGKRGVGAGEEGVRRPRGQVKSNPAQEKAGEGKVQRVRRSEAEDNRESVNQSRRRSPANCQQREGCAADSRDRGVEIGNSGVWEHVTGEGAARYAYNSSCAPPVYCVFLCAHGVRFHRLTRIASVNYAWGRYLSSYQVVLFLS